MQRHDGFSCPGRTRNPGRTGEGSLDKVSLGRMQKDRPLVPRIVERLLQFFCVGQNAEAALGVRVSKRIGFDRSRFGRLRFLAHSQFQQSFLRLLRQVLDDVEQCVLGGRPDVIHPFLGHAKGHQFELAQIVEKADRGLCDRRRCSGHLFGLEDFHLFNPLAHLDKLHGARGRVAFNLAAFGPFVGVVVVIDIDQQDAGGRAMDDDPDVSIHPHRPEIRVLCSVQLVEGQAVRGRVQLQVESGGLRSLLLLRRQAAKAVGEGVGDAELHRRQPILM